MPGDIIINGGQVTATAGSGASAIGKAKDATGTDSRLTIAMTGPDDFLKAGSYGVDEIDFDGKSFILDKEGYPAATATNMAGEKVRPIAYLNLDLVLSETTGITDAASLQGKTAQFSRTFTASVSSTLCLPFPMTSITGGAAYEFTAMEKVGDVWTATMSAVTSTEAGKPYLFKASADGAVSFSGTVPNDFTGVAASSAPVAYSGGGTWTFCGTYTRLVYGTDITGAVYGFAGSAYSTISAGDFVKAEAGAYVSPFRCYLTYTAPSSARGMTHGAGIDLPQTITVRLVDLNGQTTAIGSMDTRTGEVVFGDTWYTLDGRRLIGKPSQRGIYINNGKTVIVK